MQVKDCLKQNEELRGMLVKMRTEQANMPALNENITQRQLLESTKGGGDEISPQAYAADVVSLKVRFSLYWLLEHVPLS